MKKVILTLALLASIAVVGCKDDNPALPDNLVNFETDAIGIDDTESLKTVTIQLSRAVDKATTLTVQLEANNAFYGTDFTTTPEAVNGSITLNLAAGATNATFSIVKSEGVYFDGDEGITLTLSLNDASVVLGSMSTLNVAFASIVSTGSSMTLQGGEGGSSAVNSVFVDFSNNVQTSVLRQSWDLGFYCGEGHKVILNHTVGASAVAIAKTDLAQVTAADTTGLDLTVSTSNSNAMAIIDDVDGDLSKTVFGDISTTDAENKVFIVSRGTSGGATKRAWKKVRVLRTATGYTIQHANIADASYQSLQIDKNGTHNFVFYSFDTGITTVQPAKAKWDIQWTGGIYKTVSNGVTVPYYYSDQVLINHLANVTAAEIPTSTVTYANYGESHITTTQFSNAQSVIGANWRVTQGTIGVKPDRFYVVKDSSGNVYKLRFINFHANDGGTRGYPNIEYALVKKGE